MSLGNSPFATIDLKKLQIKPLDSSMDRAAFCCGEPELDDFFRQYAGDHHDRFLARVYVAIYQNKIVGYYWLVAQSHGTPGRISKEAIEKMARIEFAPCIYLGMIATSREMQGNGIGKALMMHAFATTRAVAEQIGVYALTLEAINEEKAATYKRWNFTPFVDGELLMFIPVATIRKLLG